MLKRTGTFEAMRMRVYPPFFQQQGDCVNTQHEQRDGLAKTWDKISTEKTGRKITLDEGDHRGIFGPRQLA